jgi:hypothetical protein
MSRFDCLERLRAPRAFVALALALVSAACGAVPSFARQTGQPCATCHVGNFGPQLTEFGIQFKLSGYTQSKGDERPPPLAGMVMTGFTHTSRSQDPSALDGHSLTGNLEGNDNLTLDQASLFVAGKMADHLGLFAQVTYDGIARQTAIDNVDLRFANTLPFDGHPLLYGVSVNNNPGVQDPFNTLPAWGFPYIASNVAPAPSAAPILDGAFARKVTGLVAYAQYDNHVYGELGTYRMQSVDTQKFFGIGVDDRDPGALRSPLYARLAVRTAWDRSNLAAGLVLFNTGYQPDRAVADTTRIHDLGGDLSWRWTRDGGETATVLANVIHETQPGTSLTEYNVDGSYYWKTGWGATLQRFGVNAPGLGSTGTRAQVDWTPWGKAPIGFPDMNLRLGLQLTAYDRLDGQKGSAAHDANSLFVFAWLAF